MRWELPRASTWHSRRTGRMGSQQGTGFALKRKEEAPPIPFSLGRVPWCRQHLGIWRRHLCPWSNQKVPWEKPDSYKSNKGFSGRQYPESLVCAIYSLTKSFSFTKFWLPLWACPLPTLLKRFCLTIIIWRLYLHPRVLNGRDAHRPLYGHGRTAYSG